MDWFFGFSGHSTKWFEDMIKVAVISAKKNTNLNPHCLYDGDDSDLIDWLLGAGVNVIRTSVPFRDELFSSKVLAANSGSNYIPLNATGHFLRILVAEHAKSEMVLYTDCDIVFLAQPLFQFVSRVAVVSEVDIKSSLPISGSFNSGVMLFNTEKLRFEVDHIVEHFRLNNFYNSKFSSYDQFLLNGFYNNEDVVYLDQRYNWRPFQGVKDDAFILHFHGPKPHRVMSILNGEITKGEEALMPIINSNRSAYEHYINLFNSYLPG